MTRAQLVEKLSFKFPNFPLNDIDMAVRVILDAASTTLANGGRVEIRGFGSFGLNYKPPRNGRNPKTGEKVLVPAKYSPHFKPGKELRERVDFPKP
jgi:integration host factor subunit beta